MSDMTRRALLLTLPVGACAIDTRQPGPKFRAQSLTGEMYDNESVKGRPVLIQCWATWCGFCRRDQEGVENVNRDFADKRLLVLAVNVGESRQKVIDYLRSSPRACKIVLTQHTNLAALYGREGLPFYLMLDGDGKIVGEQRGALGEEALRGLVRKAIPDA